MESTTDWSSRARREAVAIVAAPDVNATALTYELLVRFVAIGWIQGRISGLHESLSLTERAFERLQEDLSK